jgi:putative intracellular protease/amidase
MKKAHVLLFDGYADWELGNVLAELRRMGRIEVASVGFSQEPVVSMGGLRVQPDIALPRVSLDDILVFLLPGGYMWEGSYPEAEIGQFLDRLEKQKIPVAAICAATTVIVKAGILKGRKHTSNSLEYLTKMVPGYSDHENYVDSLAVRDRHVITASGLGPVEFAMEVMNELDISTPQMRTIWYEAFKYGRYPDNFEHDA